jgi:hypothetical protein
VAIKSVRIYFYPLQRRYERWLSANYWGWSEWFERRLKPLRDDLRGPAVKGVDIVNLMLREDASMAYAPNNWIKVLNTLQFEFVCDLSPLNVVTRWRTLRS